MLEIILVIFYSYISGSIPFGLIFTKNLGNIDIRKIGSGNIGATNVLRTGNKFLAIITLFFDVAKGYLPVLITQIFFNEYVQLSALVTFLAHIFPVWLKFKGGKGVATYLGILFALSLSYAILFIFTWIAVLLIFKYSSVSSIFSSLTILVVSFVKENVANVLILNSSSNENIKVLLFIFFVLIIFTHRKNISNLKNKKESKVKF